jgi:hypothetical protein
VLLGIFIMLLLYDVTYRQTQVYLDKVIHNERHIHNLAVKIQYSAISGIYGVKVYITFKKPGKINKIQTVYEHIYVSR